MNIHVICIDGTPVKVFTSREACYRFICDVYGDHTDFRIWAEEWDSIPYTAKWDQGGRDHWCHVHTMLLHEHYAGTFQPA